MPFSLKTKLDVIERKSSRFKVSRCLAPWQGPFVCCEFSFFMTQWWWTLNKKGTVSNQFEKDSQCRWAGWQGSTVGREETKEIFEIISKVSKKFGLCHLDRSMILLLHVNGYKSFSFWEIQVLITSVSSSDHPYLQFTFDFMTLIQNFNISYFEQKRKSYLSESLY